MTAQRRRRVQPIKKSTSQARKKRSPRPPQRDVAWGNLVLKGLTIVVFLVNVILISFIVRQCSSKPPEVVETIEPSPPVEAPEVMRIEVLNGCGVPLLAARYTDFLRAKGYDVVKTDNYESHNVEHSVVIDRQGNKAAGLKLAKDLGIGEAQVLQEENAVYLIDATVILGKDFRSLSSWQVVEQSRDAP
ncbi:LytR C-terminal domain-containing protein [bacterium]|nr:LytR C-terminal domain-containing protein [bacterium]